MIYYVEDDRAIRELVVYTLTNSGYAAEGFENGKSFTKPCKKQNLSLFYLILCSRH